MFCVLLDFETNSLKVQKDTKHESDTLVVKDLAGVQKLARWTWSRFENALKNRNYDGYKSSLLLPIQAIFWEWEVKLFE